MILASILIIFIAFILLKQNTKEKSIGNKKIDFDDSVESLQKKLQSEILNDKLDKQVERNLKAKDLEKQGKINQAINLYEQNVSEGFDGNFPYDRLAIIYRKKKDIENEIRVLKKGIDVFTALSKSSPRQDIYPKLERFNERLKKSLSIKDEKSK